MGSGFPSRPWAFIVLFVSCFLFFPISPAAGQTRFVRGDANADGTIDLTDAIFLLNFLFLGGQALPCRKAADVNDSGGAQPDISDAISILNWLFLGGIRPASPSPRAASYSILDCGTDPTPDDITCLSFPPCAECPPADGPIDILLRSSTIVFLGTVQEVEASTMLEVPISDSTAIVRVDQVLLAPPDLDDPAGTLITLVLAKPGSAQPGEQGVFFTTVLLLGNGLALREVGRLDPKEAGGLPNGIADAGRLRADKDLLARIAAADLIVTGKVLETKEVDQNFWPSEHHPDWWQASIEVGSVLKGKIDKDPILLNFPASDEEGWADSPKFGGGEEGIWIIRRNQMEIGWPAFATPGFSALNPLDFQAPDQIDRVKGLTPCAR